MATKDSANVAGLNVTGLTFNHPHMLCGNLLSHLLRALRLRKDIRWVLCAVYLPHFQPLVSYDFLEPQELNF